MPPHSKCGDRKVLRVQVSLPPLFVFQLTEMKRRAFRIIGKPSSDRIVCLLIKDWESDSDLGLVQDPELALAVSLHN